MKPLTKSLCWWTSINSKTLLLSKLRSLSITRFDVLIFNYCWIWVMIWVMKLFLKYGLFKALIFIIYIVKENITYDFILNFFLYTYQCLHCRIFQKVEFFSILSVSFPLFAEKSEWKNNFTNGHIQLTLKFKRISKRLDFKNCMHSFINTDYLGV